MISNLSSKETSMKEDKDIALLKTVKKVAPSPFLYDRIEAKINTLPNEELKSGWLVGAGLAFAVLLLFNISSIRFDINDSTDLNHKKNILMDMGVQTSNQLYND